MSLRVDVLLAAYNNPDTLALALNGYARQSDPDFILTIADDGSTQDVKAVVDSFRDRLKIRHLWQRDEGFRKARILNQAIASSDAEYLVFSDSDCIPSRWFIADHKVFAEPGSFITGRRVDLGPIPTRELLDGAIADPDNLGWLLRHSLRKNLKRAEKALRPPLIIAQLWSRKQIGTLGANMAIWREDLLRINGFDEEFQGYGMEETDLEWRLLAAGVKRRSILGRAALFHLYHSQREMTQENLVRIKRKKSEGVWRIAAGISSHTSDQ